ncbi:MAG: hypothetical protein AAF927_18515 [Bacteroidota bacterium]
MKFFWKTSVAKIENYGQVKFDEGEGFIPYIGVIPSLREKIYKAFFEDDKDSKVDLLYVRAAKLVALSIESEKYKIGFQFDPQIHIKPLAGIMKTGMIAIRDNRTEKIITFNMKPIISNFDREWKEQVVPDMITSSLKAKGMKVTNLIEHRNNVLAHLENNWMVEKA